MTLKSHSAQTWFLNLIWAPPKLTVNTVMNSGWIWFITMICHVSMYMMFNCSVQSESKSVNRCSETFFVQPIIFKCCCATRRTCPSGILVPLSKSIADSGWVEGTEDFSFLSFFSVLFLSSFSPCYWHPLRISLLLSIFHIFLCLLFRMCTFFGVLSLAVPFSHACILCFVLPTSVTIMTITVNKIILFSIRS